jgi:hypothetical protein
MLRPARFCIAWLASLLAVMLLVGSFNALIDPYDVIGAPRITGLNAFKSEAHTNTLLTKPYQIARMHPRAVVIGSSTADLGLDPDSQVWPADVRPVYNFGAPGKLPPYQYLTLLDAVAAGPVRLAIIVLSFDDAFYPEVAKSPTDTPSEDDLRLLMTDDDQRNHGRLLQALKDHFLTTLTLAALEDSVSTVMAQYHTDTPDLTEYGSTSEGGFRQTVAADGYHPLFQQKEEYYARKYNQHAQALGDGPRKLSWYGTIGQMIEFCRAHQIRPIFVIAPWHADMLDIIDRAGLWDDFERWKIALAAVVHRDGAAGASLWDFTGYDQYSTEEVPDQRHKSAVMQWFWDPVHFKKVLGDMILRRVLTGEPEGFGVELTSDNVRQHLAEIRADRQAYRDRKGAGPSRVSEVFSRVQRGDDLPTY